MCRSNKKCKHEFAGLKQIPDQADEDTLETIKRVLENQDRRELKLENDEQKQYIKIKCLRSRTKKCKFCIQYNRNEKGQYIFDFERANLQHKCPQDHHDENYRIFTNKLKDINDDIQQILLNWELKQIQSDDPDRQIGYRMPPKLVIQELEQQNMYLFPPQMKGDTKRKCKKKLDNQLKTIYKYLERQNKLLTVKNEDYSCYSENTIDYPIPSSDSNNDSHYFQQDSTMNSPNLTSESITDYPSEYSIDSFSLSQQSEQNNQFSVIFKPLMYGPQEWQSFINTNDQNSQQDYNKLQQHNLQNNYFLDGKTSVYK